MSEVNTALASGCFQNNRVVQPSLDFWRVLEIESLENKIGFNWGNMDDLRGLINYLFVSLVRKLQ